jgi:hypothetical protein
MSEEEARKLVSPKACILVQDRRRPLATGLRYAGLFPFSPTRARVAANAEVAD